jgi:hypothetical protein
VDCVCVCPQVGSIGVDFCHVGVELEGQGPVELQVNGGHCWFCSKSTLRPVSWLKDNL